MPERVIKGKWKCKHTGGHRTVLREHEAMERSPHYVVCPDCGTHWIVYRIGMAKQAMPVIVPVRA